MTYKQMLIELIAALLVFAIPIAMMFVDIV